MSGFSRELPPVKLVPQLRAPGPHGPALVFDQPDTWRLLGQAILPKLLASKESGAQLRVWCAGGSAGEDAYSIVLLLADLLGPAALVRRAKVFATDSDHERLSDFQAGECPAAALANVPERHRREYFDRFGAHFALRPMLRDVIFFGSQNLVTDAPLAHLDLVVCRKALGTLEPSAVRLVLRRLSYGLASGGYLVAGAHDQERIAQCGLFQAVEPDHAIFSKAGASSVRSLMPLAALRSPARRPGAHIAQTLSATLGSDERCGHLLLDAAGQLVIADQIAWEMLELGPGSDEHRPPEVVLSRQRKDLRGAIHTVLATASPTVLDDMEWQTGSGETSRFDIEIIPARGPAGRPAGVIVRLRPPSGRRVIAFRARQACQSLEVATEILQASEEEMRAACEELERANEELQAAHQRLADANATLVAEQRSMTNRCAELAATLHAIPRAILTTTGAGTIVACSAAAAARFGFSVERLLGQRLSTFLSPRESHRPDRSPADAGEIERLLLARGGVTGRRADGSTFAADLEVTRTTIGRKTLFVLTLGADGEAAAGGGQIGRSSGDEATAADLTALTPREREVMRLLIEGRQSKEIAHELGISRRTVDIHRGRLMRKMRARSIADLIRMAIAARLIDRQ